MRVNSTCETKIYVTCDFVRSGSGVAEGKRQQSESKKIKISAVSNFFVRNFSYFDERYEIKYHQLKNFIWKYENYYY